MSTIAVSRRVARGLLISDGTAAERSQLAEWLAQGVRTPGLLESPGEFLYRDGKNIRVCALGVAMLGKFGSCEAASAADNSSGFVSIPESAAACLGISTKLAKRIEHLFVNGGITTSSIVRALETA